jgi:polyisoprenyl-teichoic acid--peptidoglycan teichoic acid transferase
VAELHSRARTITAVLIGVALTATAGCSDDPKPQAKPTPPTTSTTTTAKPTPKPPAPKVTGAGFPADLLAVMNRVYIGGTVPVTKAVGNTMLRRKAPKKSLKVIGRVGRWKATPIASVAYGNDVTLLAKDKTGWKVVGGWWPSLGLPKRVPARTTRVLAIGSDARPNQTVSKARADSIHIVGVDAKGVGGIVGIPRDSWVPISGGGTDKLNAALTFGGATGMVRSVERTSGVQIDGYVMTGFKGFRAMVSDMGGIRFVSSQVLKNDAGKTLLKVGVNLLRGEPALSVARERHNLANGDFGRSHNQGRLILAGMGMATKAGPTDLPVYLSAMGPHIQTDLTPEEILNLTAAMYFTNPNKVPNKVAPGSVGTRGGGQSVVLLGGGARSLFSDMKDGRLGG